MWTGTLQQIVAHLNKRDLVVQCYTSLLCRGQDAAVTTLEALGELWMYECPVSLDRIVERGTSAELPRHLVDIPSYPWDHSRRYWYESHLSVANRFRQHGREDIIGEPLENSPPPGALLERILPHARESMA